MAKVLITGRVRDGSAWEKSFRTHGDLFRRNGIRTISYGVTPDDNVATCSEVDDVDAFMEFMQSDETARAMADDGVDRESVKVYVLDKEFEP